MPSEHITNLLFASLIYLSPYSDVSVAASFQALLFEKAGGCCPAFCCSPSDPYNCMVLQRFLLLSAFLWNWLERTVKVGYVKQTCFWYLDIGSLEQHMRVFSGISLTWPFFDFLCTPKVIFLGIMSRLVYSLLNLFASFQLIPFSQYQHD